MPLSHNFNAVLGAGVLGIVCAASIYIVEQIREERRRHTLAQDLARLDTELGALRGEFDKLLAQQAQKVAKKRSSGRRSRKAESLISSSTFTEDYTSAGDMDSSDLEFYDLSDEETSESPNLETALVEIDGLLDESNETEIKGCLERLQNLCIEHPESPHLLWRIAKAHYKLLELTDEQETDVIQKHIAKGVEACTSALKLQPELADVHKWLAIMVGSRTKFQPMKEKILDGFLLKQHVDAAIRLKPDDPPLHHMLGRFCSEIADLKWYERKIASALFADPPNATHEEALGHFLEAERLAAHDWKENKLCIAKCQIKMGNVDVGVASLRAAEKIESVNSGLDDKVDVEIKEWLKKYDS